MGIRGHILDGFVEITLRRGDRDGSENALVVVVDSCGESFLLFISAFVC